MAEEHWFDRLHKALLRDVSRRVVLESFAALAASLIVAAAPVDAANSKKKGKGKGKGRGKPKPKPKPKRKAKRCGGAKCSSTHTCCNGVCAKLAFDVAHCGACGRACAAGEACIDGNCVSSPIPCDVGLAFCPPQGCVDTKTNPAHCGACYNPCTDGAVRYCVDGQCGCNPASSNVPCGNICIPRGYKCCESGPNGPYGCSNPTATCRADGGCGAA